MRDVKYTTRFRRDYKREKSGAHGKKLDALLMEVVNLLAADAPLLRRHFDHPLAGEWSDHRDCHIKPDLILIYRKPDRQSLELVRLDRTANSGYSNRATPSLLMTCLFKQGFLRGRQGHKQCPRLAGKRTESEPPIERHRMIVLRVDQKRKGGGVRLNGAADGIHQEQRS